MCHLQTHDILILIALVLYRRKLCEEENCNVILIVDMNRRFGSSVRDIYPSLVAPLSTEISYPVIPDQVNMPNENARIMSTLCITQNLIVVNDIKYNEKHFESNLTYRNRID